MDKLRHISLKLNARQKLFFWHGKLSRRLCWKQSLPVKRKLWRNTKHIMAWLHAYAAGSMNSMCPQHHFQTAAQTSRANKPILYDEGVSAFHSDKIGSCKIPDVEYRRELRMVMGKPVDFNWFYTAGASAGIKTWSIILYSIDRICLPNIGPDHESSQAADFDNWMPMMKGLFISRRWFHSIDESVSCALNGLLSGRRALTFTSAFLDMRIAV